MIKLPHNDPLRKKWQNLKGKPCVPAWADEQAFLTWAMSSGYEPNLGLYRKDNTKPYGPKNCFWKMKEKLQKFEDTEEGILIRKWNQTVNVIRQHYGLPLFEEG